jgi:hypothetical protein
MSDTVLHVFAVNADLGELRHTFLTRASNEPAPDLPPLAQWLGAGVDTGDVELFPVADLAPMRLSDYLAQAFDIAPDALGAHAARLSALQGHVLLVPGAALDGAPPRVTAQLTRIATLPLPRADQSPAAVPKMPEPEQSLAPRKKPMSDARMSGMVAMLALAVLFLLVIVMVVIA